MFAAITHQMFAFLCSPFSCMPFSLLHQTAVKKSTFSTPISQFFFGVTHVFSSLISELFSLPACTRHQLSMFLTDSVTSSDTPYQFVQHLSQFWSMLHKSIGDSSGFLRKPHHSELKLSLGRVTTEASWPSACPSNQKQHSARDCQRNRSSSSSELKHTTPLWAQSVITKYARTAQHGPQVFSHTHSPQRLQPGKGRGS